MIISESLAIADDNEINRPQEKLYKDIASSGPGSLLMIDADKMKVIYYNDHFQNTFGFNEDDVKQPDFLQQSFLDEMQIERLKVQFETVSCAPDASNKYFLYKIRDKNSCYNAYYGFVMPFSVPELSIYHHFQLLLFPDLSKWPLPFTSYDTRELFLEQFNNEHFGTFEWLIDTDKVFWSDGIYRIHEMDENNKHLNYDTVRGFTHPDDKETIAEAVRKALENNNDIDMEYRIITKNSNIKTLHSIARILCSNGKPVKLVGSVRDITEQRHVEQSIKKHLSELNRSNRDLEEFAYVASHDMQEPLRKISTFCERLQEKYAPKLNGDGVWYLERIMTSTENMRQLISNLLDFSRLAKAAQSFTDVNLNFILHQVKSGLELVIEETGMEIQADELPIIYGSSSQMNQLFNNIINNSIKFRKQDRKPCIKIYADKVSEKDIQQFNLDSSDYLCLSFEDNGIGFEQEYALRIFQLFQRLHGKSEYPGTGIGLAICKKIAENHKGYIYAVGIPDEGAKFNVILPVHH